MKIFFIFILFFNIIFAKNLINFDLNKTKSRIDALIKNPFTFQKHLINKNYSYFEGINWIDKNYSII